MMSDGYSLPKRKAWICRVAGGGFLFVALWSMAVIAVAPLMPEVLAVVKSMGGEVTSSQIDLLSKAEQAQVNRTTTTRQAFEDYLKRPAIRLGATGVTAVEWLPYAILLLGVGQALRRFGGRDADPLARAVPWLRRASVAGIVWAVAVPVSDSLMLMLIYPGTPAGPHWMIAVDFGQILVALLLAIAAFATVWALEAGVRAQRDLAEIV